MKKILILTAFALAGLASAQDTNTDTPPADTTQDTTAPADTTTDPTTDPAADPAMQDEAAPADTTTDPAADPAMQDEAAPADPTTDPAADPATSDAMPAGDTMMMTAEEHFNRAAELAAQADVAYPAAFYDRTLWKSAVDEAYLAANMNTDRAYAAYLAQLYTKTQWWINAYNAWGKLGTLGDTEKQYASLSAAKLAYIALQRGDREAAMNYVQIGMEWADSPSLQAIMKRLQ